MYPNKTDLVKKMIERKKKEGLCEPDPEACAAGARRCLCVFMCLLAFVCALVIEIVRVCVSVGVCVSVKLHAGICTCTCEHYMLSKLVHVCSRD
jgi:hypothetical protein